MDIRSKPVQGPEELEEALSELFRRAGVEKDFTSRFVYQQNQQKFAVRADVNSSVFRFGCYDFVYGRAMPIVSVDLDVRNIRSVLESFLHDHGIPAHKYNEHILDVGRMQVFESNKPFIQKLRDGIAVPPEVAEAEAFSVIDAAFVANAAKSSVLTHSMFSTAPGSHEVSQAPEASPSQYRK